jgi:ABC-type glycerol-3-phosphate transport system substrate-binding protein
MKTSLLLALGAVTLVAAGCATQTTHNGTNTYILDGLVTVKTGYFQAAPPSADAVDTTRWSGNGNPSGTSISVLDDAYEFNNY